MYRIFHDFYKIFIIKLQDCPKIIFLTVSLNISSEPFSPIKGFSPICLISYVFLKQLSLDAIIVNFRLTNQIRREMLRIHSKYDIHKAESRPTYRGLNAFDKFYA